MASFMQKALQYLGLKDIEDEDFYDDEETREPSGSLGRTTYPDQGADMGASSGPVATVRPLVRDDARSAVNGGRQPRASCGRSWPSGTPSRRWSRRPAS